MNVFLPCLSLTRGSVKVIVTDTLCVCSATESCLTLSPSDSSNPLRHCQLLLISVSVSKVAFTFFKSTIPPADIVPNIQVNTINGVEVGLDPKFTDTIYVNKEAV